MKKALKIIPTIISILSLIFLGFLALIYIPGPKSEPVTSISYVACDIAAIICSEGIIVIIRN